MHHYPHHIGDYRSATMHLSNDEDLAYRRLLEMYYDTEKPIPAETQWVSRRLRLPTEAIENVLKDFFFLTERGWEHERCEQVIAEYQAMAARNANNGRKGGRPRKNPAPEPLSGQNSDDQSEPSGIPKETQQKPSGFPVDSQPEPTGKATINHKPITNNQRKKTNTTRETEFQAEFEEVWVLYPTRPGASKANALKAYVARRRAGSTADEIKSGVDRYAKYVATSGTQPQFIKQPETFFGVGMHFLSDWTPPVTMPSQPRDGNARFEAGMQAVQRAKERMFGGSDGC